MENNKAAAERAEEAWVAFMRARRESNAALQRTEDALRKWQELALISPKEHGEG